MMMYRLQYRKMNIFCLINWCFSMIRLVSSGQPDASPPWSGGIHPTAPSWPAAASQRSVLSYTERGMSLTFFYSVLTQRGRELSEHQFSFTGSGVGDPHCFQCGSGSRIFCQYGSRSRVLMTKNGKKITAEKKIFNLQFTYPWPP